jgi:hypothetical protein
MSGEESSRLTRRELGRRVVAVGCCAALLPSLSRRLCSAAKASEGGDEIGDGRKIRGLRRLDDTIQRLGGHGDNWHMSWAKDDRMYVGLCDGKGLPGTKQGFFNSRVYTVAGEPPEVRFEDVPGYPELPFGIHWYYGFGLLALDDHIYQFLTTPIRPLNEPDPVFVGAKLIYSPDNGHTWHNQDGSTPVRWEDFKQRSKQTMVFYEEPDNAFALLTVLQMGRNYEHNRDGFVYIYSPNGSNEGTMNQLALCRVAKGKILDRGAYQFFSGRTAADEGQWSAQIEDRKPVHEFPAGWVNKRLNPYAWHPSVVYFAPTDEYLMANWGMGTDETGEWFVKPSYLGFWTAPRPWGPWRQVHEETAWTPGGAQGARAYQPQIAPKWIANDGKSFWLVWTDFGQDMRHYAFNAQRVEVEF